MDSIKYKYYSYDSVNGILYHEVTDDNCGTYDDFVLSMSYYVTLIDKFKPQFLIIIIRKKPGYFELELDNFMKTTFYKIMNTARIKKIAYIVDKEIFNELKQFENYKNLDVKFFTDMEVAKEWLLYEV